jgi:hypothetical protein
MWPLFGSRDVDGDGQARRAKRQTSRGAESAYILEFARATARNKLKSIGPSPAEEVAPYARRGSELSDVTAFAGPRTAWIKKG